MKFLKKHLIKIIIILVVLVAIGLLITKMILDGQAGTSANERALVKAAEEYYANSKSELPSTNYATDTISSNILINKGYLKPMLDSNENVIECSSYVTVTKVGKDYIYSPFVNCGIDDDTELLYDHIVDTLSSNTLKDGRNELVKVGNEYVYRGDKPNNYITFAGKLWRIIKIDDERNIKLIYAGSNFEPKAWDDRYNVDRSSDTGINDFSISRVKEYLDTYLSDSENFSNTSKSKIALVDICIGKRGTTDLSTDGAIECSERLPDQLIYLIQANEYLNASNDPECPTNIISCKNYNYLAGLSSYWSITGVSGSTSKAYRIYPEEGLIARDTSTKLNVLPVLSLRSDTVWIKGTGTKDNPFEIR
jgi:hypothetical protein